jgi:hypothetical protein
MLKQVGMLTLCCLVTMSLAPRRASASSEDECIQAQERLKDAKDDASEAAQRYAACVENHDNSDDCSDEKQMLDTAHEEVEDATDAAGNDCS